jgi:hypothetical protein
MFVVGESILRDPSDEELGKAVLEALTASTKDRADAPYRPVGEPRGREQWRRAGASSQTAYIDGSRVVMVHRRNRRLLRPPRIYFYPSSLVPREGFSIRSDRELVSVDSSLGGIGRGLREALALCGPAATTP